MKELTDNEINQISGGLNIPNILGSIHLPTPTISTFSRPPNRHSSPLAGYFAGSIHFLAR